MIDGVAGARSDLAPAPSVDIANGAPTGADATDRIVMTYVSGDAREAARLLHRVDERRRHLVGAAGDRGRRRPRPLHRARDLAERHGRLRRLQRVHDAVPADDATPRALVGVVLHAVVAARRRRPARSRDPPRRARRPARHEPERPDRRVPRRLRLRRRDADVRRGGLERHARRGRLPGHRRLAAGAADGSPIAAPPRRSRLPGRTSATPTSSRSRRRPKEHAHRADRKGRPPGRPSS